MIFHLQRAFEWALKNLSCFTSLIVSSFKKEYFLYKTRPIPNHCGPILKTKMLVLGAHTLAMTFAAIAPALQSFQRRNSCFDWIVWRYWLWIHSLAQLQRKCNVRIFSLVLFLEMYYIFHIRNEWFWRSAAEYQGTVGRLPCPGRSQEITLMITKLHERLFPRQKSLYRQNLAQVSRSALWSFENRKTTAFWFRSDSALWN